jgi:hypothetical protein
VASLSCSCSSWTRRLRFPPTSRDDSAAFSAVSITRFNTPLFIDNWIPLVKPQPAGIRNEAVLKDSLAAMGEACEEVAQDWEPVICRSGGRV